ncbi:MAG: pantetheine-phosphate adenylyltransferase [Legionellales bacterium]|jgi:pantetheine-phosphate adenylyltransferase
MKTAIFPGTFDPMTRGHSDLVERACQIFDKIIVAVAQNPGKKPLLSLEQRISLAKDSLEHLPNIDVEGFSGLLVDFATKHQAKVIIRSLRSSADFEHESQLAYMGQQLAPHIQTVFLTATPQSMFISSSLVREIAQLGGDVSSFVHPNVMTAFEKLWH